LAGGPCFRRGVNLPALSIADVAPTLLQCAGVAIPDQMHGTLPIDAFDRDRLSQMPQRRRHTAAPAAVEDVEDHVTPQIAYDTDEETLVLKRLAALGYLE